MADSAGTIRLRGLVRRFREGDTVREVLRGADADIAAGERVLILGRSGSGKSTLLNLVAGIDLPDAGEVTVGDLSPTRLSERERTRFRRRHVGFVFQFFQLIATLNVLDNVRLPLELNGVGSGESRRRARDMLDRVGLADRAGSYPDRLSGGEQQRVAVARALVHQPRVVLADEPTGNLDAATGERVLALLADAARDLGATVLIASHSRDARAIADRCLLLADGRLGETAAGER